MVGYPGVRYKGVEYPILPPPRTTKAGGTHPTRNAFLYSRADIIHLARLSRFSLSDIRTNMGNISFKIDLTLTLNIP